MFGWLHEAKAERLLPVPHIALGERLYVQEYGDAFGLAKLQRQRLTRIGPHK